MKRDDVSLKIARGGKTMMGEFTRELDQTGAFDGFERVKSESSSHKFTSETLRYILVQLNIA